jgi:hypothetical protein
VCAGCNQHIAAVSIFPTPFAQLIRLYCGCSCVSRLQELEQRGGHLFGLLFVWQMA